MQAEVIEIQHGVPPPPETGADGRRRPSPSELEQRLPTATADTEGQPLA
jgi:hypothetical protein